MPATAITILGRTLLALLFLLAGVAKLARNLSSIIWPLIIFRACCCRW
jgi:hypothetical protein